MIIMKKKLIESSRKSYKLWFNSMSDEEREELSAIGIQCRADAQFFKQEILDIHSHLNNPKLKENRLLFNKFINRFLALIPKNIHSYIDREFLEADSDYRAWLISRQMFVFNYLIAKSNFDLSKGENYSHILWSPVIDSATPQQCYDFNNKIFKITDIEFQRSATEHWSKPQKGCKCSLISINNRQAEKYIIL